MILAMVRQVPARIPIPEGEIDNFCHKWDIKTFELFGSVLRDDFDSRHASPDRRAYSTQGRVMAARKRALFVTIQELAWSAMAFATSMVESLPPIS